MSLHDELETLLVEWGAESEPDQYAYWKRVRALLARHPEPAVSGPTAEQVLTIAEGLRKRFAVSNGTQVWVEFQGSVESLADEIADIFAQLQPQAPAGEGLENGVSDGERRWMIATLDAVDVEHDFDSGDIPSTTTYVDALIADGYRKAPVVNVEDVRQAVLGMELTREFDVTWDDADMITTAVLALFESKEES